MKMKDVRKVIFGIKKDEEMPNLDDMLLEYDEILLNNPCQVRWDNTSVPRHTFAGEGSPMNGLNTKQIFKLIPKMIKVQLSFQKSKKMSQVLNKVVKTKADETVKKEIFEFLFNNGAGEVGVTQLSPDVIFKDKGVTYKNAIVFTMRMLPDKIKTAPSVDCLLEVQRAYGDIGKLANDLTKILRKKGYGAVPGPGLGGVVDYPSLAKKAGIGIFGRHGLLISKSNGACQRIAAVFTSVENFDEISTDEYDWIYSFCAKCGKCIKKCPSRAIRETPTDRPQNHKSCVDGDICLEYFHSHYGCSVCIKECPFTSIPYEKIKERYFKSI